MKTTKNVIQLDVNKMELIGIQNSGMSCFAAAVLQSLIHIPAISFEILTNQHETEVGKQLKNIVSLYVISGGNGEEYTKFPSTLLWELLGLDPMQQQDAHEFFTLLLEKYSEGKKMEDNHLRNFFRISQAVRHNGSYLELVQTETDAYNTLTDSVTSIILPPGQSITEYLDSHIIESDATIEPGEEPVITEYPLILCISFAFQMIYEDEPQNTSSTKEKKTRERKLIRPLRGGPVIPEVFTTHGKRYTLHSVIEYVGNGRRGHYTCLLNYKGQWTTCNDSCIKQIENKKAREYLNGIQRYTCPAMCFYVLDEARPELFDVQADNIEVAKPPDVISEPSWLRETLDINIATLDDFDPMTLRFSGSSLRLRVKSWITVEEFTMQIAEEIGPRLEYPFFRLYLLAESVPVKQLPMTGNLSLGLSTDSLLILPAECEQQKDELPMFCLEFNKSMVQPTFIGYCFTTRERNIIETFTNLFPQYDENPHFYLWNYLNGTCVPLNEKSTCSDFNWCFFMVVITEVAGTGVYTPGDPAENSDSPNIICYIPDCLKEADAQLFYRSMSVTFWFIIKYNDEKYELSAPVDIGWDDFCCGVASYLGVDRDSLDTSPILRRYKNGKSYPPIFLFGKIITLTDKSWGDKDDNTEKTPDESQVKPSWMYSSSSDDSSNEADETIDSSLTATVKSQRVARLVYRDMTTDDESLRLSLSVSNNTIQKLSVHQGEPSEPESNFTILQDELNEMKNRVYASPTEALAEYAEIVKVGPMLTSPGKSGSSQMFTCKRVNCGACLELHFERSQTSRCEVLCALPHKCISLSNTSIKVLDRYMTQVELKYKLGKKFMDKVRMDLNDPNLTDQRIRRSYHRVHGLCLSQRLSSWKSLPNLCQLILRDGGTAFLWEDKNVKFCGIMPSFAHIYMRSRLWFPVIGLSEPLACGHGQLISIVTLTGSRNVLPLAYAWAINEKEKTITDAISALLRLMNEEEQKSIDSVISYDNPEDISATSCILETVREVIGDEKVALCPSSRKYKVAEEALSDFRTMIQSRNKNEYIERRESFKENFRDEFEMNRDRIPLLSRWENDIKRDGMYTDEIFQSFNSMCAPLKKLEPFIILREMYAIARAQIILLLRENGRYTRAAEHYLELAVQIAQRAALVTENPDGTFTVLADDCQYQVDMVLKTCSCGMLHDYGLPCIHIIKCCIHTHTTWEDLVHPRYIVAEIKNVFPEIPASLDFTVILPTQGESASEQHYTMELPSRK